MRFGALPLCGFTNVHVHPEYIDEVTRHACNCYTEQDLLAQVNHNVLDV